MSMIALQPADPLVLPRLTRNEAQARSQIAQRAQACPIVIADQPWDLALEPWPPGAQVAAPQAGDWLIQAQWAGALFDIQLPLTACQRWVAARFPALDLPAFSEPFAAAALEDALADLLSALQALQRGPAQLERILVQPAQGRELGHAFGLTLSAGEERIHGSLATSSLGLMLMAGLVSGLPLATNRLDEVGLPIVLRAEIGMADLPADTLLSLSAGDTVLIQHVWLDQQGALWLGQGDFGIRVLWQDTQLIVTQTLAPTGLAMPTDASNDSEHDQPLPLGQVPVRLSFDLGERTIALAELQALQVGQALDLARPLSNAVSIRVNGALIGTGELVEIDGRIGVTIATLARPAP